MKLNIGIIAIIALLVFSAVAVVAQEESANSQSFADQMLQSYGACTYYYFYCVPINGNGAGDAFGYCC